MRHIDLPDLRKKIEADIGGTKDLARLPRAYKRAAKIKKRDERQLYIRKNGPKKWSPIKDRLTSKVGAKCWYTEVEIVGAHLTIDHYRPITDYWWLAFELDNYRVACPFCNSPEHNNLYKCSGGKGDQFPLVVPRRPARVPGGLKNEAPVILDPCVPDDCDLLTFQTDGRPVLNPSKKGDLTATRRVEDSKLLLNLDHPDFNSKREQLYEDIKQDVTAYGELPAGSASRKDISDRMERRLMATAPFSAAARTYCKMFRNHKWMDDLLKRV